MPQGFLGVHLVAEIGHVGDDQGARGAARYGLGVMEHLLDGDGQGARVAEFGHADGVAHEDHVDACLFGQARGRIIVGREHRDLEALSLHLEEGGDSDGFCRRIPRRGLLIDHDATV